MRFEKYTWSLATRFIFYLWKHPIQNCRVNVHYLAIEICQKSSETNWHEGKKYIYNDWFWYEKQSGIWNCIFVEFDAMNIIYLQTKYDLHGRLKNIKKSLSPTFTVHRSITTVANKRHKNKLAQVIIFTKVFRPQTQFFKF